MMRYWIVSGFFCYVNCLLRYVVKVLEKFTNLKVKCRNSD